MATTALIVEILVVGAMALSWMVGGLLPFFPKPDPDKIVKLIATIRDLAPLILLPLFALTYAIGWVVNFCSERALKPFFQRRVRARNLGDESDEYEIARLRVLQKGSAEVVHDLAVDRHIIRMARGAVLNFAMLAVVFVAAAVRGQPGGWALAILFITMAGLSFGQWFTRYKYHYARIRRLSDMFLSGML